MTAVEGTTPVADTIVLTCEGVYKVFGSRSEQALVLAEEGLSRDEILHSTGSTIAVRDVSFEVRRGETFVVMGLLDSGSPRSSAASPGSPM